jgi:hypothetical protein
MQAIHLPFVALLPVLVALLTVACANASSNRPSASNHPRAPSQPPPEATYGPAPPLIDGRTGGEAILLPTDFALACSGDLCTVSGNLTNIGGHPRTSGKMIATLVDMSSNTALSGCETGVSNLNPGDKATVSCQFSRRVLFTRSVTNAEVKFEVSGIKYALS